MLNGYRQLQSHVKASQIENIIIYSEMKDIDADSLKEITNIKK